MWLAVIVVKMAVFLSNTAMNTPLQTLEIIGGENRQFFLCKITY
jgi:hypothetical protein